MGGSSTTPQFEGNEPRVYEIESAALHPLYHALPEPVEVGRGLAEGTQQIFGRTKTQGRRRTGPPLHRECLNVQGLLAHLPPRTHASPAGFPQQPSYCVGVD